MEVIDLYDRNRQLLNETAVRGEKLPKGRYRLVVHICLFNEKDEMLIQQRQTTQKHFPNMWDLTVGGQVSAGETSFDELTLQKEEVQAVKWASEEEILDMIGCGEFIEYYEAYIHFLFSMIDGDGTFN